ncbi:TetR family transcriptional regulator [Gemmatimonas sp.]|uniref:TetR family transcriptional regulator n=1 Tax=Gemmatimonas sp. TaxID=1962908 RepID=UPI0039839351
MELADARGIDRLTMRSLASELGIEAMSLYPHVANKEQILDGTIDLGFDGIERPSTGLSWSAARRWRATSAHRVLIQHAWRSA